MANIYGLYGYNRSSSAVNKLLAVYGNDIFDVDTGTGFSQNLTASQNGEFETYVDKVFFVNGTDASRSYNGTAWSQAMMANRMPIAKYLKRYRNRLYAGYVTIQGQTYPSRVWFTDLPQNNDARWGLEYGTNLTQTADSAIISAAGKFFQSYGIKAGDPFWILTGANAGQYEVFSVDTNNQITLTAELPQSASNSTFIVGSNYFDVNTDDNDYVRGLGANSDRLLVFKLNSLHRYNTSSLFQVKGAPGTSSHRSITDVKSYTLYFHGSEATDKTGIYMYDGTDANKISAAIQPYIDGIAASIFPSVVGWTEGNWARFYVGDITNAQRGISVTKAVISYDVANTSFSIDPINKVPTAATVFRESNQVKIFFGDDSGEVFQTPSGFDYDGSPIPWAMESGVDYPEGPKNVNTYTRVQIISRDARGIGVRYKLYNTPKDVDDTWQPLGQIENDKTELKIDPRHCRGSGIELRLEETSIKENTQYIEHVEYFYIPEGTKMV